MVARDLSGGFADEMGFDIRSPGDVRMAIEPQHVNGIDTLMGPVTFALVDYAMAGVAWEAAGEGEMVATVSIAINFVGGADSGGVRCTARLDRRGRSIATLSAAVNHDDGRLLATAIGTFAIMPATNRHERAERPAGSAKSSPEAVVAAFFTAVNEDRFADALTLFAPEAVMLAPGAKERTGDAIGAYFATALAPFATHRDEIRRLRVAGSTVMADIHFRGSLTAGGWLEFDGLIVFELDQENRIVGLTSWQDTHEIRRRLAAARGEAPS